MVFMVPVRSTLIVLADARQTQYAACTIKLPPDDEQLICSKHVEDYY
jgi:hypothetical protein